MSQYAGMHDPACHVPAVHYLTSVLERSHELPADDGPKELQWRIQHGEGPFGLQAKLAVVHIGSRDIGKCGTPVGCWS